MKHIYTSIDIGSDTIKVVVCELFKNKLSLLAASSVKSEGIKKGLITDVNGALKSVKKAITEVESMLGVKVDKVIATVPSYMANFTMVKGKIDLSLTEGETIQGNEIVKVLQKASSNKLMSNEEMITLIPIDFMVDDKLFRDPKGKVGKTLSARAIMASTPKKNIYSVASLFNNLGIEIVDISLNGIGDIYAFKKGKMDEQMGAIINIGHEITNISLYNKGVIVKNSILQYGGKNIEHDIAYIYKISDDDALKIKENFALSSKEGASLNDFYEVETTYGEKIKISQSEVSEVVSSRIEEILELSLREIMTLSRREVDYIIITGGTSNLSNLTFNAKKILGDKATIENIKIVGVRNNKYSSALGNIVYFINKLKLQGKNYTMMDKDEVDDLSSPKRNSGNTNETMLGKVFGYFFE